MSESDMKTTTELNVNGAVVRFQTEQPKWSTASIDDIKSRTTTLPTLSKVMAEIPPTSSSMLRYFIFKYIYEFRVSGKKNIDIFIKIKKIMFGREDISPEEDSALSKTLGEYEELLKTMKVEYSDDDASKYNQEYEVFKRYFGKRSSEDTPIEGEAPLRKKYTASHRKPFKVPSGGKTKKLRSKRRKTKKMKRRSAKK
jgi:hypothetical protein